MSQRLQRLVVRMLYDPGLVAAVYAGAPVAGLDERDRPLLTAVDRRAWGTDPYRRSRSLSALIEEYPASAALVGVERLDAFFSSEPFHACIQDRGSLALAFGDWLSPLAGPMATLERAIASVRRPRPEPRPDLYATAAHIAPLSVPQGTLALYQDLRARLGPNPAATLVSKTLRMEAPLRLDDLRRRPTGPEPEHLLVERDDAGEVGVGEASAALVALLEFAMKPRARAHLFTEARALGADPGEEAELIDGLCAEGLLAFSTSSTSPQP